ncbi:MAG TPA: LysE family transporter [Burkholderiaceae bacterium]|nr:LysE family transporter [Burkholderiaceae bacterium]
MLASLIAIALLHWAVLIVPGFNFVLIGQLAAGGSRRAALAAVVGMTTATLAWAALAVAGVGAVFSAHPALRQGVQLTGGTYLLYLALQLARSGGGVPKATDRVPGAAAAFRAGFFTSALNPKIALFYGSVFATALPADPSAAHVVAAVLLVYANSWLWHGGLALVLSRPQIQRAYLQHYRTLTRFAAALVGMFGVRLIAGVVQEFRARTGGAA